MVDSSIVLKALGLIALALLLVFLLPRERSKEEVGLPVLYEERCSRRTGRFGFFAGTNLSSIRISLYDTFLVIRLLFPTKILYTKVRSVEYRRQWVSWGLNIRMRNSRVEIVLFPRNPQRILAVLRDEGVTVAEH